jgi:diaminopimelate decarboxylase
VIELLEKHAREQPERTVLARRRLDGRFEETSYRELLVMVRAFAEVFRRRAPRGSIVPLWFGRTARCVAAALGVLVSGRAFCVVSPRLRLPQIERILADTRSSLALVDAAGLAALRGGLPRHSIAARTHWIVTRDSTFGESSRKTYGELAATASTELWDAPSGERREASRPEAERQSDSAIRGLDSVGACLFTSGSTGTPKGVLVGYADLIARARAEVRWYGLEASDVLLSVLPFSFDVGLNQLLSALVAGAELVVVDSWLPLDIQQVVSERKVTGISAVPTIWADFMRANLTFQRDGAHRSLRYMTISGGDLTPTQQERVRALADGADVFKTYGQTEAFRCTSLRPEEYDERPLSVGRPFSGVHVYVVREDGVRARPGEIGEVVHTGLGVMLGYLDGEDGERKLRKNPFLGSGDGSPLAVFTGDMGYLDEQGFLFLRGRRDELVKTNGNRVYPSEVKNQLSAVPGVALSEVVVVRDDERAELAGFVVPRAGVELDPGRLRSELSARLPAYMIPTLLSVEDDLPRTASGKPDRPELARRALERLLTTSAQPTHEHLLQSSPEHGAARVLLEIVRKFETPCFVYFMDMVAARAGELRRAFEGRFGISFAMKSNPHPELLRRIQPLVDALDVSSAGELEAAVAAGWPARTIAFTGPAKRGRELETAVRFRIGEVVVESLREAELLAGIARSAELRQKILLRVAPSRIPRGFGVNMAGRPSQFGIDEEDLDAAIERVRRFPELELAGLHAYSGTQCLLAEAVAENYAILIDVFRQACQRHELRPSKLILGSGLGIPYHEGERPVDLSEVASRIGPKLQELAVDPYCSEAQLLLETGRFLVGEAGYYLTRVVNRKHSRGTEIATLDGGMHHHLGAAGHLGMALPKNYRISKVFSSVPNGEERQYDLYGPLCTTIDLLGRGVRLPGLEEGDVLAIHSSGAYALTASPSRFISHPPPGQLLVESEAGRLRIVDITERKG